MNDQDDLQNSIESVERILQPLAEGEFSQKLNKVSAYMSTIGKSWSTYNSDLESINLQAGGDQCEYRKAVEARTTALKKSIGSSLKFSRMNLDQAMSQALDKLIRRPKSANKIDGQKKMKSLQDWFDKLPDPAIAMLGHFKASSNPLDKYLVAGQWGHDYLRKRKIDPEDYDQQLCELLSCSNTHAGKMVLCYGRLCRELDTMEKLISTLGSGSDITPINEVQD